MYRNPKLKIILKCITQYIFRTSSYPVFQSAKILMEVMCVAVKSASKEMPVNNVMM